jgi:hypothetical protein
MESEAQKIDVQNPSGFNTETPGMIAPAKPSPADKPWQEWIEVGSDFLSKLYDYLGEFISDNRKLLINLGLLFGAIVAVKLTLAILDAINDIPLLAPLFELVGLGYTGWFVYRYLLKESTRQELVTEFEALKTQVLGNEPPNT